MSGMRIVAAIFLPMMLIAGACSSGGTGSNPPGTGGSHAGGSQSSGGNQGTGGASQASGGSTGAGSSASGIGGATTANGGLQAGGTSNAGGSSAPGGASGALGSGGEQAGGGATSTSGTIGKGGVTGNGGVSGTGGTKTAGASGTGGASQAGGATVVGGTTGNGGSTGAGGATASGGASGSGGATGKGGAAGGGATGPGGSGGTTGPGGASGSGGTTSNGGSTGTSVTVSPTCKMPNWPTATGSPVTISKTMSVTDYDGKGALHDGASSFNDCTIGDQSSTTALIEVADGGSVKNVVFGTHVGDGIHCLGSCTIDNVWFPYICDDAITINIDGKSSGTSTISNSGFKGARDKIIQHNGGSSTLNITGVYAEVGGKLYRSCGSGGGCTTSANHTVNVKDVVAIGVNQIVGISTNDKATLSNICTFRSPVLCNVYEVNSDNDSTVGANGTGEGPSANCSYKPSDSHALVDRVAGATLDTDVLCPGPNSVKSGSSASACVSGFETCLKTCAPGMYGFKEMTCSGGNYTSSATGGCALVTSAVDSAAAKGLDSSNASSATSNVTKNNGCSTEWAWGKDSSSSANYCACVEKPGYYQNSSGSAQPASWMVWDCQAQWW